MPLFRTFTIRFLGGLNIFLTNNRKNHAFSYTVKGAPSIKDTVEALHVPHTEIDAIIVDGKSVDFCYQIKGGEKIKVYPDSSKLKIGRMIKLKPRFPYRPRFLADVHLGKLTHHLRLLGFDTLYKQDYTDRQIVDHVKKEKRIVLTRDIGLLKNKAINYGYFVRATDATERIKEVVKRFNLCDQTRPFTLCLECNGPIRRVAKSKIAHKLPAATKEFYTTFYQCRACGKVYWKGSHHHRLNAIINHACRKT